MRLSRQLLTISAVAILVVISACSRKDSGPAGPLHLDLTVSPDRPSMNQPMIFHVHVTGADGMPVSDAEVNGVLTMKIMDMGGTQLKFAPKGDGDYQASVRSVDMSGPWSVAVNAKHGGTTAKQNFDVNVFD